jgi:hypothetical protein
LTVPWHSTLPQQNNTTAVHPYFPSTSDHAGHIDTHRNLNQKAAQLFTLLLITQGTSMTNATPSQTQSSKEVNYSWRG